MLPTRKANDLTVTTQCPMRQAQCRGNVAYYVSLWIRSLQFVLLINTLLSLLHAVHSTLCNLLITAWLACRFSGLPAWQDLETPIPWYLKHTPFWRSMVPWQGWTLQIQHPCYLRHVLTCRMSAPAAWITGFLALKP